MSHYAYKMTATRMTGVLAALSLTAALSATAQTTPATSSDAQTQASAESSAASPATSPTALAPAAPAVTADAAPAPNPAKAFIQQAYLANEYSIAAGQLATSKAHSAAAKDAAAKILADGLKVRTDMVAAIQNSTSDMHFDQNWDDHYKQMLAQLQTAKGAEFDKTYLALQSDLEQQTQSVFSAYASVGTDTAVKSFASNTLPVLQSDNDALRAANPSTGT